MKCWEKCLAVSAATILVFVGVFAIAVVVYPTEDVSNPPIESEDTNRTVEPEPVVPTPERLSVEEIYSTVELGMTEEMVRTIAGEPDMVSTSEIEGFGTMKDLIYVGGFSDNVSVLLEDDTVRVVIVGHVNSSGDLDTKTKM